MQDMAAALALVEAQPDARRAIQAVLAVHAAGLRKMLGDTRNQAPALLARWGEDPAIGSLLCLHGLHPVPLRERVAAALASQAPTLAQQGARAWLLTLVEGEARLAMSGPAAQVAARQAELEDALLALAPDLVGLTWEVHAAPADSVAAARLLRPHADGGGA